MGCKVVDGTDFTMNFWLVHEDDGYGSPIGGGQIYWLKNG
jgi:hypothetical protein